MGILRFAGSSVFRVYRFFVCVVIFCCFTVVSLFLFKDRIFLLLSIVVFIGVIEKLCVLCVYFYLTDVEIEVLG